MANVSQYQYELTELCEFLLRKENITEGLWTIGVAFQMGAAIMGPEPSKVRPSAVISIDKILLTKTEEDGPLTVDASKLK